MTEPDPPTRRLRPIRLALGLAIGCLPLVAGDLEPRAARTAAIALAMAVWWLTEAMPIHWTASVPIVAFPLAGAFGRGFGGDVAAAVLPYFDPYNFLFAGGMAIAAAIEQQNLHRRIALSVMNGVGTDPRRLLAGTLLAARQQGLRAEFSGPGTRSRS